MGSISVSGDVWNATDWEDHVVAERCLAIANHDDVITTGGSGCIALCLLLKEPRSVVAIHPNPATIALCELKVAAIRFCSQSEFRTLVGDGDGLETPSAVYERIRGKLPASLRDHWDARPADIAVGLLGCGIYERAHRAFRERLERVPGATAAVGRLFELEHIAGQLDYLEHVLRTDGFLEAYRKSFSWDAAIANGTLRPNEARYVEDPDAFTNRYLNMMRRTLSRAPARDNFYLQYFLTGRLGDIDDTRGPPYLRPNGFGRLKELVDRIRFVVGDPHEVMGAAPQASFDKAYLLGMTTYGDDERDAVIRELARILRPGGRWSGKEHRFSAGRATPQGMRPLPALVDEVTQLDRFPRGGIRRIETVSI